MTPTADVVACDYCGLPVAGARAAVDTPLYCCSGCRFAAAITEARGDDGEARWMMTRLGLAVFFTMNVMVFTMLLWSQPEGDAAAASLGPAADAFYGLARHACLLFTAPVLVLLGAPLCADAVAELRRGSGALNSLLLAGVAAAFGISAWNTWRGAGHVYFEVSCMVLVAVTLGRWLEATGKLKTTAALRDLRTLLPDRVRLVGADGEAIEVPLDGVRVGDVLRILPGEHLPTDGRITSGSAAIDERAVTGESEPAVKRAGDAVHSGTCDLDGDLLVTVTAPPGAGTLERLIDAVAAAASTSRRQRLAERISAWFLPVVLVVAVATCVAHWLSSGPAAGVLAGLAVVVVSCPCALGLATPMALWAAIGRATRRHVLVRDGDAFVDLAGVRTYCFDKTGTLTTGSRVVAVGVPEGAGPDGETAALAVAAALAAGSTHVYARAIADRARSLGVAAAPVADIRSVAGVGVAGTLPDGTPVRLGSVRWIEAAPVRWQAGAAQLGTTTELPAAEPQCVLAVGPDVRAAFWMAEEVRPEAPATLAALRAAGAETIVLSGDRAERAAAVAEPLGMAWRAPLLPEEKLAAIERLETGGRVCMVGDGINDAPALAAADVGVALGCGADVSRWSADICLLRDDLAALPWLADLAARTRRTIRWNLLWAFGYNAACIPAAATGLVHPAVAAAAMVASSLLVVTNSLRLGGTDEAEATA